MQERMGISISTQASMNVVSIASLLKTKSHPAEPKCFGLSQLVAVQSYIIAFWVSEKAKSYGAAIGQVKLDDCGWGEN